MMETDALLKIALATPVNTLMEEGNPVAAQLDETAWRTLCVMQFQFTPQQAQQQSPSTLFRLTYTLLFCNSQINILAAQYRQSQNQHPYSSALTALINDAIEKKHFCVALDHANRYAEIYLAQGHIWLGHIYYLYFVNLSEKKEEIIDMLRDEPEDSPYRVTDPTDEQLRHFLFFKWKIHIALSNDLFEYSDHTITQKVTRQGCEGYVQAFNISSSVEEKEYAKKRAQELLTRIINPEEADAPIVHIGINSMGSGGARSLRT